ncbi:hypothetical protein C5167_047764 [Papaver somniferum]|uniref:C2 domain-containing protein n=1 Tax=Papaver somniferum TaxID=3469 RepID=A0A4Y7LHL7_PAPSO|nr:uncharacterized protein LOC113323406 [Papaver somniferum]RZC84983.1 hypothetical protein C5167_047764 [Papaver somniferum]
MRDHSASSSPKGEEIMNLLEINLISAQGLKQPSSNLGKRFQTYAITYIDPSFKLRTRIDKIGSENPTWNDKFFFKVPSNFVSLENSAISIEIYSVGVIKDQLIGTVRFLINNDRRLGLSNGKGKASGIPFFTALQIRRPLSGRFFGVLNVGFIMVNDEDLIKSPALIGVSGIGFRDLMGVNRNGNGKEKKPPRNRKSNKENENQENSGSGGGGGGGGGGDSSDADSTCSSSSNLFGSSSILKDLNWRKDLLMMGKNRRLSEGGVRLCGLMGFQRKIHLSPSDQNLYASSTSFDDDHSN